MVQPCYDNDDDDDGDENFFFVEEDYNGNPMQDFQFQFSVYYDKMKHHTENSMTIYTAHIFSLFKNQVGCIYLSNFVKDICSLL